MTRISVLSRYYRLRTECKWRFPFVVYSAVSGAVKMAVSFVPFLA